MKKKKSGIIIFIIVSWIVLTGLSVFAAYKSTHCSLYKVEDLDASDGCVYGISSERDGKCSIFAVDIASGTTDSIMLPAALGNPAGLWTVRNCCYISLLYPSGEEQHLNVLRYDPLRNRIRFIYSERTDAALNLISEGYYDDSHCVILFFGSADAQDMSGIQTMVYIDESGKELFREKGYALDRDFYYLEAVSENRLAWVGIDGDIVTSDQKGNRTVWFDTEEDGGIHRYTAYTIYPDRAEFTDEENNETVRVALTKNGMVEREPAEEFEDDGYDTVYAVEKTAGGQVMLLGDGYGSYKLRTKNKEGITSEFCEIDASPKNFARASIRFFALFTIIFAVLSAVIYFIYRKNNRIIPSVIIIFLILSLIAGFGSYYLAGCVNETLISENKREDRERMEKIADSIDRSIDRDLYQKSDISGNYAYIYELSYRTDQIFNGAAALDSDMKFITRYTYNIPVQSQFFKYNGGEFFPADGADIATRSVRAGSMEIPHHVLMEAAESGNKLYYEGFSITRGGFCSIVCPVISEDGTIAGAFAVMIYDDYLKQFNMTSRIELIGIDILIAVLVLIIGFILAVALNPVIKMAGNLERLTETDDCDEHVEVRGCDEVQELTRVYNRLIDNVRHYFHKTGNIRRMNNAFIPNELVALMGKQSIADIEAGDSRKMFSVVYSALHTGVNRTRGNGGNTQFDRMNQVTGSILESVQEHGGIALRVDEQIVTAFFSKDYFGAVKMAVDAWVRSRIPEDEKDDAAMGFVSVLSASDAGITVEGIESHMEFVLDKSSSQRNEKMARQALVLRVPVLATDSVIRGLGATVVDHHIRYVGRIEHEGNKIRLYEVFDWESGESIGKKEETRDEFESGVRAMEFGKYDIARNHFGNVLKFNSLDKTAGVYFRQCDALHNKRKGE